MEIIQRYLTNNPCYSYNQKINVRGLMLHSVGCSQPSGPTWCTIYNKDVGACVHGFIDANDGVIYQTLPWNHRGWHGGGSSNDTHIGVEMCESGAIRYTSGASFVVNDKSRAVADAKRAYKSAVELFAYLCKKYNLNPMASGVIISHSEGYRRGVASNHADPEHYWRGLGLSYTMDGFRRDVNEAMGNSTTVNTKTETTTPTNNTANDTNKSFPKVPFTVKVLVDDLNIRTSASMSGKVVGQTGKGTFTITKVSGDWGQLKSSGNWIYIRSSEYCKIGATVTSNKTDTKTNTTPTNKTFKIKVTCDCLNIRKGPGTNYDVVGTIQGNELKYTYTITETKNNWGKLKSNAGWICLDYTKKV